MAASPAAECQKMKHLSFPRTGPSGDTAQSLECRVLDGRAEADRDWIRTESGLDETVKELVSTAPTRSGHSQPGSSVVLSLVRTEDANADALIGVSVVIEANRLLRLSDHGGRRRDRAYPVAQMAVAAC